MEEVLFSLLEGVMALLPLLIIILFIVTIVRFMNRYEQRANAQIEFEKLTALHQQEQMNALIDRLDRIEETLETRR
ncbi:MAG: hypothetical protein F9K39_03320 [Exiguobacterium chiriqhucha]|uniref:hypothetical protein n=1 Tax=Exiguobacterium TaxID=33986 RepID=UPI00144CB82A|nr:hypothetical protein [Exiguobacterium chiriqhucha]KAB2864984.1 MAG: hypothetical protein F9K39_03320 [Exiguobacterium chiriqhucha]